MRHLLAGAIVTIVFTASVVVLGALWSFAKAQVGSEAASVLVVAVAAVFWATVALDWYTERHR